MRGRAGGAGALQTCVEAEDAGHQVQPAGLEDAGVGGDDRGTDQGYRKDRNQRREGACPGDCLGEEPVEEGPDGDGEENNLAGRHEQPHHIDWDHCPDDC